VFLEDEEANLQMKNVQLRTVGTEEQALHYHMMGSFVRRTAATCLNQASSRSHCIFTLNIRGKNLATLTEVYSKLHLVDLAGSERVSRSQAEGAVLTEARSINLSLTYLEQVIVSLNQKARGKAKAAHVPYRNSLLTTLLRDSLGGNCKTVMIATISTDRANLDETISTLRFAQRVKLVQNETTKNEKNPYSTRIDLLERENAQLRKRLAQFEGEGEQEDTEEDAAAILKFMNQPNADLEVDSLAQARRYFRKMKELYSSRMSEYVKELTFISEKLNRYDAILTEKHRKRNS
jgi:kinesin family protein 6/9